MPLEVSAGGVVIRRMRNRWCLAAIEPAGRFETGKSSVLALPKGLVNKGESPDQTAQREVEEETGIKAKLVTKLDDVRYFYVRSWGDRARVFKIVSFYLFMYESGRLGQIAPEMRKEVARARWLLLEEAPQRLTYRGEKDVARKALEYVREHLDKGS